MLSPIYKRHMKFPIRIEQVILYSIGLGILGFIMGGIFDSRFLLMIGAIAFLPLCIIFFLAALGAAWEAADGIIPNFKGKQILVVFVVLLVAVAFIFTIFIGVGNENLGCPSYRGELTC